MKMLFRPSSSRIPPSCPKGTKERYTVKSGDTMWLIAEHYKVIPQDLIDANKHIQDPSIIFPGDVLCIPKAKHKPELIKLPCCTFLKPKGQFLSADTLGIAMTRKFTVLKPDRIAISIVAHCLPNPATFGAFNGYEGVAFIPDKTSWRWILYPSIEPITTWASTFTEITAQLTPDTVIEVRPVNTMNKQTGTTVLSGKLCRDCD
jgi:LysM repeat protein